MMLLIFIFVHVNDALNLYLKTYYTHSDIDNKNSFNKVSWQSFNDKNDNFFGVVCTLISKTNKIKSNTFLFNSLIALKDVQSIKVGKICCS